MVSALTSGSAVQVQDPAWHIEVVLLQGKTLCFLRVSLHLSIQLGACRFGGTFYKFGRTEFAIRKKSDDSIRRQAPFKAKNGAI